MQTAPLYAWYRVMVEVSGSMGRVRVQKSTFSSLESLETRRCHRKRLIMHNYLPPEAGFEFCRFAPSRLEGRTGGDKWCAERADSRDVACEVISQRCNGLPRLYMARSFCWLLGGMVAGWG
jgi:hypothetical protein